MEGAFILPGEGIRLGKYDYFVVAVEMADGKRYSLNNAQLETLADKAKTAKIIVYLTARRWDGPPLYQYGIITPGMDRKAIADRAKETLKRCSRAERAELESRTAEMMHHAQPEIILQGADLRQWYEHGLENGQADTGSECDREKLRKWLHPKHT